MSRYFGVSPLEATFNRYFIPYSPDGGLKSVGLASSLDYKWSETWSTTLFGRYDRLAQARPTRRSSPRSASATRSPSASG